MKNFYMENDLIDVVSPVRNLLSSSSSGWKVEDGKIVYVTRVEVGNGWNITVPQKDRRCIRWLHVFFNIYGIVPEPCLGCFKVVVIPRTLKELMRVKGVQENMGLPSKCGIELRQWVGRPYGAYWYAPLGGGLKVARRLFEEVKKQLEIEFRDYRSDRTLPELLLKRGCTEMERAWGPSNKWKYGKMDKLRYELLEAAYADVPTMDEDPSFKKAGMFKQWIEFAYSIGDITYLEYSDPLFPAPVVYQDGNQGVEEEEIEVVGGEG